MVIGLWEQPDELASLVSDATKKGFAGSVLDGARHLYRMDESATQGIRCPLLLANALIASGELSQAKTILHHPALQDDAEALEARGRLCLADGDFDGANALFWRAIMLSPNKKSVFDSWLRIQPPQTADAALFAATKIAGSWRAKIVLAKKDFSSRRGDLAVVVCREIVSSVSASESGAAMSEVAEMLGEYGYQHEIIELLEKKFSPKDHGIQTGRNLIKAYLDLGQFEAAKEIVGGLYAVGNQTWHKALFSWSLEIARAANALAAEDRSSSVLAGQTTFLSVESPLWVSDREQCAALLPPKNATSPLFAFMGATIEASDDIREFGLSPNNEHALKGFSLLCAEELAYNTEARTFLVEPWIGGSFGCALASSEPWHPKAALAVARSVIDADYCVLTHFSVAAMDANIQVRVIDTGSDRVLKEISSVISVNPKSFAALLRKIVAGISQTAGLTVEPQTAFYLKNSQKTILSNVTPLCALLSLYCMNAQKTDPIYEAGGRELIFRQIWFCEESPTNVVSRAILTQMLDSMKIRIPGIVGEFEARLCELQKKHPIRSSAGVIVGRRLAGLIAACD